jgi:hypothetical protein
MRPIFNLTAAMMIAAASCVLAAAPADATFRHHHGHHHSHHHWKWGHGGGYFYYEPRRRFGEPIFGWKAHVRWCLGRYRTYIPATNLYVDSWGRRRRCNSPFD